MTPEELQNNLAQFIGTEYYHKWSSLFRNFVLTDGVAFLAQNAGAYWLIEAIASHSSTYKDEGFVVAKLFKFDHGWKLRLEDGNDNILVTQNIDYSDFPLEEITLYVIPQEMGSSVVWVILLPSEY